MFDTGKRWLKSQKWFPLMAIRNRFCSIKINNSNFFPIIIGQPPVRSSAAQLELKAFRTIHFWLGRMSMCSAMLSTGCSPKTWCPDCKLIASLEWNWIHLSYNEKYSIQYYLHPGCTINPWKVINLPTRLGPAIDVMNGDC